MYHKFLMEKQDYSNKKSGTAFPAYPVFHLTTKM